MKVSTIGVRAPLLLLGLALAVSLALLSWGHDGAQQIEAVDPALEFNMDVVGGTGTCTTKGPTPPTTKGEAKCSVPLGTQFIAEVRLDNPGAISGQVLHWQAVIEWTAGLVGPGDPSSTKTVSLSNCPAGAQAVTLGAFQTLGRAAAICALIQGSFTDAEATAIRGVFQLNCGATPSQELVTMRVTVPSNDGTHIRNRGGRSFADKDGGEVLTINCVPPVGGMAVDPELSAGALEARALETPEASSGNAGLLAGVAAGVATAVVTLGTAWYARRRVIS